jgi:hypothetical protein
MDAFGAMHYLPRMIKRALVARCDTGGFHMRSALSVVCFSFLGFTALAGQNDQRSSVCNNAPVAYKERRVIKELVSHAFHPGIFINYSQQDLPSCTLLPSTKFDDCRLPSQGNFSDRLLLVQYACASFDYYSCNVDAVEGANLVFYSANLGEFARKFVELAVEGCR